MRSVHICFRLDNATDASNQIDDFFRLNVRVGSLRRKWPFPTKDQVGLFLHRFDWMCELDCSVENVLNPWHTP